MFLIFLFEKQNALNKSIMLFFNILQRFDTYVKDDFYTFLDYNYGSYIFFIFIILIFLFFLYSMCLLFLLNKAILKFILYFIAPFNKDDNVETSSPF